MKSQSRTVVEYLMSKYGDASFILSRIQQDVECAAYLMNKPYTPMKPKEVYKSFMSTLRYDHNGQGF